MSRGERVALALLVAGVALAARWVQPPDPRALRPRPDALEYAAAAQSIAQWGEYRLQVGPLRVRPRYPPGFPLLLAGALRAGVPPLELWRVPGLFGAGTAALVALLAAALAARGGRAAVGAEPRLAPWVAGLTAGLAWAVAPVAVVSGRAVMSDEPSALVTLAAVLLLARALLGEVGRPAVVAAAGGGLLWGLAAAMRPIAAALAAVPVVILLLGALRREGLRRTAGRLKPALLPAFFLPALVALLLWRSELAPWKWSGYELWAPHRFAALGQAFQPRFALEPHRAYRLGAGGEAVSNLQVGLGALLGLPSLAPTHRPGLLWPLAGWAVGGWLWWRARREARWATARGGWLPQALLAWALAHLAAFSFYFYPAGRFYLAVLPLAAVLLGAGAGEALLALHRRRSAPMAAAAALVLLAAAGAATSWRAVRSSPAAAYQPPPLERAVARRVEAWLALDDAQRGGRPLPFDPVFAQALGLLPPRVVAGVGEWGRLPRTRHTLLLVQSGRLDSGALDLGTLVPPQEAGEGARARRGRRTGRPRASPTATVGEAPQ